MTAAKGATTSKPKAVTSRPAREQESVPGYPTRAGEARERVSQAAHYP